MQNTQPKNKPPDPRCGPRSARALSLSLSRSLSLPNSRLPTPDPPNLLLFPQSLSPPPLSLLPAKRNPSKAGRGGGDCAGWRGAEEPRANHPARRRRGKRGQEPSRVPRRRSGADARRRHHRSAQRRATRRNIPPPADASSLKQKRAPREPRSARISAV